MTRIFQALSMGDAHLRAALVRDMGQADLLVHRVGSWGLARHGALWYITRRRQDAEVVVHFCSPGMAQLRICFVPSCAQAGWVTAGHPVARRLFRDAPRLAHGAPLPAGADAGAAAAEAGAAGAGSRSVGM